jgi:hypothetical protein
LLHPFIRGSPWCFFFVVFKPAPATLNGLAAAFFEIVRWMGKGSFSWSGKGTGSYKHKALEISWIRNYLFLRFTL